jgi:hypothetical protein
MRGHQTLIDMRCKERKAPAMVFINDYPCATDWLEQRDKYATVCVHGDHLETLDLRFLVGLRVSISADTEDRAKALWKLARENGAAAVAACHVQANRQTWEQSGWVGVWDKERGVVHG